MLIRLSLKIQSDDINHRKLGEILLDRFLIDEHALLEVLSLQMGFPLLDPEFSEIDPELFNRVNSRWYEKHNVIPIHKGDGGIVIAFTDPLGRNDLEAVKQVFGDRFIPGIARKSSIKRAVRRCLTGAFKRKLSPSDENSITKLVDDILLAAIERNASDIHIRDNFSAEIAVQAALTGHKVLTTFHTEDSIGGLVRLQNMKVEAFLISSTVVSAMAQRLLRKICPVCAVAYKPSPTELKRIGYGPGDIPGATFRKGHGCGQCQYTGYRGRIGIFELLVLDEQVRNAIVRLGINEVSNMVMLVTHENNFRSKDPFVHGVMRTLWRHSLGCAMGSNWLAKKCGLNGLAHEAFFAGLLHDVGKLFILTVIDDLKHSDDLDIQPSMPCCSRP